MSSGLVTNACEVHSKQGKVKQQDGVESGIAKQLLEELDNRETYRTQYNDILEEKKSLEATQRALWGPELSDDEGEVEVFGMDDELEDLFDDDGNPKDPNLPAAEIEKKLLGIGDKAGDKEIVEGMKTAGKRKEVSVDVGEEKGSESRKAHEESAQSVDGTAKDDSSTIDASQHGNKKRIKSEEAEEKEFLLQVFGFNKEVKTFELINSQSVSFNKVESMNDLGPITRPDLASLKESSVQGIDSVVYIESPAFPGSFRHVPPNLFGRWTQAAQGLKQAILTCRYIAFPIEVEGEARRKAFGVKAPM